MTTKRPYRRRARPLPVVTREAAATVTRKLLRKGAIVPTKILTKKELAQRLKRSLAGKKAAATRARNRISREAVRDAIAKKFPANTAAPVPFGGGVAHKPDAVVPPLSPAEQLKDLEQRFNNFSNDARCALIDARAMLDELREDKALPASLRFALAHVVDEIRTNLNRLY